MVIQKNINKEDKLKIEVIHLLINFFKVLLLRYFLLIVKYKFIILIAVRVKDSISTL